jgi:hypothetical protein
MVKSPGQLNKFNSCRRESYFVAQLFDFEKRWPGQSLGASNGGKQFGGLADWVILDLAVNAFSFNHDLHGHSPGQFSCATNCSTTMRIYQHSIGVVNGQFKESEKKPQINFVAIDVIATARLNRLTR